jgi:FAD/FMN-containing dehydrogenase/Fe-S oxidoreductase
MSGPAMAPVTRSRIGDPALARRLAGAVEGEVRFDAFERGRYATDASIYQIEPIGVVRPRSTADIEATLAIAREEGVPVIPRGAGTSQNGQPLGEAVIVDTNRHLDRVLELDPESRTVRVEPGVVLERLNARLRPHGLFFPVEPSTASRCTIGGMAGNNSSGARSLRYGKMVDNVQAIDAVLADGTALRFDRVPGNAEGLSARHLDIVQRLRALGARVAPLVAARFPKVQRRVGGYNLDTIDPRGHNLAHILVGSEGTLAFSTAIELRLSPLPRRRVVGVCHFPTFRDAMESTRHLVELGPVAVELVDRNILLLGREIPMYRTTLERIVRGDPDCLLLVELAGDDEGALRADLRRLDEAMADLGFPDSVVLLTDAAEQTELWALREGGLNIMMSMKGDAKPVSFIEDCAVPLEHLADYTANLEAVFARHGTSGTWYAHASVGCLHVRPILDLKDGGDVRKMRAIAEEAIDLVRAYKGSHSGEHGDGISRSEFHEKMFGPELVEAFREVKRIFDPEGRLNPGKIVDAPRMDDRALMRFKPGYAALPFEPALDWSPWDGLLGAVEMCNNNGACRKLAGGVMCPSYRATREEKDVTRGRANSLRLALTGQLGPDALMAEAMRDTLALCVSCKACRRECPTGVDMARMKIEATHTRNRRHGVPLRERLIAELPRYAPLASRLAPLANLAGPAGRLLGLAPRPLPRFRYDAFRPGRSRGPAGGREVVLLADCFDAHFEPDNLRDALGLLTAAGYRVHHPGRICCGRTYLAAGMVEQARTRARRTLEALGPFVEAGVPVVGIEPSCLLTFRDELPALLPGEASAALADRALLLEELLADVPLDLAPGPERVLVHGHCHQKAFGVIPALMRTLGRVPGLSAELIESSCCGMAGAFGYQAEHHAISMRMAELSLLPAVRAAPDVPVVAAGFSCRHQISDGTGREALHPVRLLACAVARDDGRRQRDPVSHDTE